MIQGGVCFACNADSVPDEARACERTILRCRRCRSEWLADSSGLQTSYEYSNTPRTGDPYLNRRGARLVRVTSQLRLPGRDLLDIGCGLGEFITLMAADGWSPVGVELEPAVAARASAQSGLTVLAGSVGNLLGRLAGSFDVVTLWGVLEHVHNPLAELAAATNCLRPGGMLLLETPNSEGLFRTAARGIFHLSHGKLATPYRQLLGAGHIAWFSSAGIRAAAARLDLTVVRLSGSHNDTAALMQRWNGGAAALRLPAMAATAVLNVAGEPIGRPNQLVAALRTRMPPE